MYVYRMYATLLKWIIRGSLDCINITSAAVRESKVQINGFTEGTGLQTINTTVIQLLHT